jgi:uncharacterized Zn finger protein
MKIMTNYIKKKCPECGQMLRFPVNIGGMLMACPSCGKKFHSDFKLADTKRCKRLKILINTFEMPSNIIGRISRYFSSRLR